MSFLSKCLIFSHWESLPLWRRLIAGRTLAGIAPWPPQLSHYGCYTHCPSVEAFYKMLNQLLQIVQRNLTNFYQHVLSKWSNNSKDNWQRPAVSTHLTGIFPCKRTRGLNLITKSWQQPSCFTTDEKGLSSLGNGFTSAKRPVLEQDQKELLV